MSRKFLDPEVRRVLLEEIAFQRSERSLYRGRGGSYDRERADRADYTIRAIRDIWDRLVAVERRRAEDALAARWTVDETTETYG